MSINFNEVWLGIGGGGGFYGGIWKIAGGGFCCAAPMVNLGTEELCYAFTYTSPEEAYGAGAFAAVNIVIAHGFRSGQAMNQFVTESWDFQADLGVRTGAAAKWVAQFGDKSKQLFDGVTRIADLFEKGRGAMAKLFVSWVLQGSQGGGDQNFIVFSSPAGLGLGVGAWKGKTTIWTDGGSAEAWQIAKPQFTADKSTGQLRMVGVPATAGTEITAKLYDEDYGWFFKSSDDDQGFFDDFRDEVITMTKDGEKYHGLVGTVVIDPQTKSHDVVWKGMDKYKFDAGGEKDVELLVEAYACNTSGRTPQTGDFLYRIPDFCQLALNDEGYWR